MCCKYLYTAAKRGTQRRYRYSCGADGGAAARRRHNQVGGVFGDRAAALLTPCALRTRRHCSQGCITNNRCRKRQPPTSRRGRSDDRRDCPRPRVVHESRRVTTRNRYVEPIQSSASKCYGSHKKVNFQSRYFDGSTRACGKFPESSGGNHDRLKVQEGKFRFNFLKVQGSPRNDIFESESTCSQALLNALQATPFRFGCLQWAQRCCICWSSDADLILVPFFYFRFFPLASGSSGDSVAHRQCRAFSETNADTLRGPRVSFVSKATPRQNGQSVQASHSESVRLLLLPPMRHERLLL